MADHHRDYDNAGECVHNAAAHAAAGMSASTPARLGRGAFRRAVASFAGVALVVAAVLAASTLGRQESKAGKTVLDQGSPSDVAAQIISSAAGFNRDFDDLIPHDDPESPDDTRLEANYPQLAESIVKHGHNILDRLIHGPPPPQMEGIPMPVDDEEPPDADGTDDDAGGEPPQTTPPPDPSADQGDVASAIIADSNVAREQNLASADTNGNVTQVAPSSPRVSWSNVGAVPEANAYNYENEDGYKDPDDPNRPLMGTGYLKGGRNYWRVNDAGENTDTTTVDGVPVMQLGALGGGYAPTSTEGLGPAISEKQDNGAQETDQFTIDTTQDNQFHGSASSWLPIQTATEQTGATAADTGAGMSDAAYLSDFGKKGPSTASVPGSSLTISAKDDNAGKGETFSISTEQADAFDCGDNCVQSPTSTIVADPDAPNIVDQVVGDDPQADSIENAEAAATVEENVGAGEAEATTENAGTAQEAANAPQNLALLPMNMNIQGDVIRQSHGPAGMSGDSGPAPI